MKKQKTRKKRTDKHNCPIFHFSLWFWFLFLLVFLWCPIKSIPSLRINGFSDWEPQKILVLNTYWLLLHLRWDLCVYASYAPWVRRRPGIVYGISDKKLHSGRRSRPRAVGALPDVIAVPVRKERKVVRIIVRKVVPNGFRGHSMQCDNMQFPFTVLQNRKGKHRQVHSYLRVLVQNK